MNGSSAYSNGSSAATNGHAVDGHASATAEKPSPDGQTAADAATAEKAATVGHATNGGATAATAATSTVDAEKPHGAVHGVKAFRVKLHQRTAPRMSALKVRFIHTKARLGKFKNLFNPNHRHDEPHELRVDHLRTQIAQEHRYNSFAPERTGCDVKWYVDARDYFWAVSIALDNAKECIYIEDWWLSPELYMRRPPTENKHWRLDHILKRRAEAGVRIFVIVYKEVEAAITCNSAHTKTSLEQLCPAGSPGHGNIKIMRHPDHNPLTHGSDMTWFYAHHEKFVVIDHSMAFVGGLDLCFGRWDTRQHPLADVHPEGIANEVWPGQDFNNNRVLDFQNVQDWQKNALDKKKYGRMPWHDVHLGIRGPAVMDVAEHFVGRWNFIKRDKYKRHARYPWLRLTGSGAGHDDALLGVEHPRFPVGGYETHPRHKLPHDWETAYVGEVDVQLVRSSSDWSHGIQPTEHSIQNAYRGIIENAEHFVYIENQFFITATGTEQAPVHNTIGASIVAAVARAHSEKRTFRVIIVIPAIPGFPGDLREDAANGTRAIIDYQYKSLCRGEHSIFGRLRTQGVDKPEDYISIFNLRSFDRLHTTSELLEREKATGVSYSDVQAAAAVDAMGARGVTQDDSSSSSGESDVDEDEVRYRRRKFEAESIGGVGAKASIAGAAMAGQPKPADEPWDDGADHERENLIQEELYVHAKVLIADDTTLICGSANINDRSQLGNHDSELAAVVRCPKLVGQLRRMLWMEHLGLLPPQPLAAQDGELNCLPPGAGANELPEDTSVVDDPLSPKLWKLWTQQADTNTEVFRQLFHCDPDDEIRTWKDYDEFLPRKKGIPEGHLHESAEDMSLDDVKRELGRIRGHLVWFPLHFLEKEEMAEVGLSLNRITESIYT